MSQAPSVGFAALDENSFAGTDRHKEAVSLRGTTRGLEILISGTPTTAELGARLSQLLAEAPGFFAGSQARVAIDGTLPSGALACLEQVATRFELQLVEIGPVVAKRSRHELPRALHPDDVVQADLAEGTGPVPEDTAPLAVERLTAGPRAVEPPAAEPLAAEPPSSAAALAAELAEAAPPGARLVVGPVRSGMIVDHPGHVIVIGDVNPCAEVRAGGSIIVLGRLRGVAHAAIGRAAGFIIALTLQPQQLRIGRMVARADDADRPGGGVEIAYATGETIVVERFSGRLPSGLAASM
jgi:septum site-determining protein MinC